MVRLFVGVVSACFELEVRFCEFLWVEFVAFLHKCTVFWLVCFSFAMQLLIFIQSQRRYFKLNFDRPLLHVYQFFHGDVALPLIYQN